MDATPTEGLELSLHGATKRFGPVVAVAGLDVTLTPGRIHALIGENGAGKSTALKMLAGYLEPTAGEVRVDGRALTPATPQEAMRRGVGMVHQHFMLVEPLSALENLVLGREPVRGLRLDLKRARRKAEALAEETGLGVPLDVPVRELSVGERQRLEILRVLYRGARAVLLDEPTAVLSPVEVDDLYRTLGQLKERGTTLAVVTHRLDEVVRFCDDVTVMRRGEQVLSEPKPGDEPRLADRLTRAIMGREVAEAAEPPPLEQEASVQLALDRVTVLRPDGRPALSELSLEVRAGEVVGVAGVEGNGQSELAKTLAGLLPVEAGTIRLKGKAVPEGSDAAARVRRLRRAGLVVVHEDRHHDEMILGASIAENLILGDLEGLSREAEYEAVNRRFARFDVYPPDPSRLGGELSGGNQQKVVMARSLDRPLSVLVAAQPTRGVDVGTARTIQHAIADVAAEGAAVIVISADLHELRALSHRLLVLRKGQIVAEFAPDAGDAEIGHAMLGHEEGAA